MTEGCLFSDFMVSDCNYDKIYFPLMIAIIAIQCKLLLGYFGLAYCLHWVQIKPCQELEYGHNLFLKAIYFLLSCRTNSGPSRKYQEQDLTAMFHTICHTPTSYCVLSFQTYFHIICKTNQRSNINTTRQNDMPLASFWRQKKIQI